MLTAMDQRGLSYDDALAAAAAKGYAEADPTLDVGGYDARSKLAILIRLAFGVAVEEGAIEREGITRLTKTDYEYARMLGGTIKLMGVARTSPGSPGSPPALSAFVSPVFLPSSDPLASVSDAVNAVEIESANLGRTAYAGEGAGRGPTANSVVSDLVKVARGERGAAFPPRDETGLAFREGYESRFYIRLGYRNQLGITKDCGALAEEAGISIFRCARGGGGGVGGGGPPGGGGRG
jgi:homoserine dehydrogenase